MIERNAMDEELQQTPAEDTPPRDPREVVFAYTPQMPQEVVEYYYSPYALPAARRAPAPRSAFRPVAVSAPTPVPRQRSRKGLWVALCFLLLLLISAGAALLWQQYSGEQEDDYRYDPGFSYEYEDGTGTVNIPISPLTQDARLDIDPTHGDVLTPQAIYELVNPATVTVMAQMEDSISVGTGILFTNDGYLLTNFHVVEDTSSCTVALVNGSMYEAKYVAGDKANDIAILKMEGKDFPAAAIGDSDALTVGDPVYAIGNPLGLELRNTFTDGIVSAINRNVWVDGRTMTLVQTNAALNSGNSGGPLINQYGQVVGINTIKMSSKYNTIEGLGFALPTSAIAHIINDLMSTGEIQPETSLGITVNTVAQQLPDGTMGLLVYDVTPGTGAAKAGVQAGDLIVQAGGQDVTTSASLLRVRRNYHAGDTLPLRVWREGKYLDFDVVLQEAKPSKDGSAYWKNHALPSDGK